MTTRRKFLIHCSAVAAVAGLQPDILLATPGEMAETPLEQIRFADFAAHRRSSFGVWRARDAVEVQLVAAKHWQSGNGLNPDSEDAAYEKFSLLFRGSPRQRLGQDQYLFSHPSLGRFHLFIVPVLTEDAAGAYYEAVFNRPLAGVSPRSVV